ncbi:MAG: autotransporter domain-containing protein [Micropepsaceae bacterium]
MRSRFISLKSGVSAIAVLAAAASAQAADTVSGPTTADPYVNAESDIVTVNLDATIRADATTNDSFFNGKAMSNGTANLIINDSTLLGDIVNIASMIATTGTAIQFLNDSQIFGQISNSGLISGTGVGILLTDDSTIAGGIDNTGTIGAGSTAVLIGDDSELTGGITNSGTISANNAGIAVNDAQAELWGGIHNQQNGLIYAGTSAAILLSGNIYEGGITNAGTISGQTSAYGILIMGGTFEGDITNSGLIQSTASSHVAIEITGGTFNGGISNSGSIVAEATNDVAIRVSGLTDFNGSIVNESGGVIRGDVVAISLGNVTFDGDIINDGEITSNNGVGITENATTFTGNINNQLDGTITAVDTAVHITSTTFTGNFTNAGSIESTSGDAVIIDAVTFTGSFTNSGHIEGSDNGVVFTGTTFAGNATNSGTINSHQDAVRVESGTTVTGNVVNSGSVHSTSQDGIDINGTVSGAVTNQGTGTIYGLRDGIDVDGVVTGGIANQGTIIGETGAAIDVSGSASAHTVTQSSGLIQGGNGTAVGVALRLNNASADHVNANGGTIDGNIVGGAGNGDDVIMNPGTSFTYLRGTASNLDQFDMQGAGTALLGAAGRGETGSAAVGVTVGAASMTHSGAGTVYLDDDTAITLSGAYAQTNGTLEYFLTPDTTTYGTISAGSASLDGRIAGYVDPVAFAIAGGTTFTYQNVIAGTTSGTFTNASSIDTNSLFFEGVADINASDVDIILTRQAFSSATLIPGLTHNQAEVGAAIETIYGNGSYGSDFQDLYAYLFSLPAGSEEAVQDVYDELAGAEHADTQEIGLRLGHSFDNAVAGRLYDLRASQSEAHTASLGLRRYAEADPIMISDAMPGPSSRMRGTQNVGIWAQAFGDWTDSQGDSEASGYDQETTGVAGGVDVAVNERVHAGGALGWSNANADFQTPGDNSEIDAFSAAIYAAFETGHFYADAILSYGAQDINTERQLDLGFGTFAAASAYGATSWSAHGEAGWMIAAGAVTFEPFAALQYALLSTDSFQETGAGAFDLFVSGQDAESLASRLGARLSTSFTDGGIRFLPSLEVAWRHEYMDNRQSILAAFEEDPTTRFQIVSSALASDSATVKARFGTELSPGLLVYLDYNGLYNSSATTHGATAGLRASW